MENMQVETMKDSKKTDQCENIKSYKQNNSVKFIPVDAHFDSIRSTRSRPILANKTITGKCVKSPLNLSRSKLKLTESSGQKPGTNEVSKLPSKPGAGASRRPSAEKLEGHVKKTQKITTHSTEKSSTPIRRSGIRADPPWKTSSTSTRKAQPSKSFTSQVQAQQITTKSAEKPSTSKLQKVWIEKTQNQPLKPSASVQRTVQANSSFKIFSTTTKTPHLQKDSLLQKTVQDYSSSKLSSPTTKKAHLQKDSSSQKAWREKIQKQPSQPSSSVQRTARVNSSSKSPSMSNNGKTQSRKDSSAQKVSKEENKKQTSTGKPKRLGNMKPPKPVYHIRFDGFVSACESVTECCLICEQELNPATNDKELVYYEDEDEYDYDDPEPTIIPSVSFLGCGHVFHSKCLDSFETEDPTDPVCIFCLSNLS